MNKKFYIHIGNHKTGTTAIQQFLNKHYKYLETNNIIYPKIGHTKLYPFNNHNIAWELTKDPRFNIKEKPLNKLYKLINKCKKNIIISSEDFESLNFDNNKIHELKESIIKNQYKIKIIIYLRNQVEYFSSFYQTILLIGHSTNDLEKLWKTLENKDYLQINNIKFWFNYFNQIELVKKVFSLKDTDIICKSYDENKENLIQSFLNILNIDNKLKINFRKFDKINASMSDLSQKLLHVFNQNHEKYNLSLNEKIQIKDILINKDIFKTQKFMIKDKKLKSFMINRFRKSNILIEKKYNISINKFF